MESGRPVIDAKTKAHQGQDGPARQGKMGLRASDTAEVSFDGVRVPAERTSSANGARASSSSCASSTPRAPWWPPRAWACWPTERPGDVHKLRQGAHITFGRPLIKNQALQFKLAEMATRIEMARLAAYRAA